jgi:hypothetical protein
MNISFDEAADHSSPVPVTSYMYRDMSAPAPANSKEPRQDVQKAESRKEQQAAPERGDAGGRRVVESRTRRGRG